MLPTPSKSILSVSPAFSSNYSKARFAEIASRVVEEIKREEDEENEEDLLFSDAASHLNQLSLDPPREEDQRQKAVVVKESEGADEDAEDDFEFAFVPRDPEGQPITADEIFANGQIRPIYPIFNGDLIFSEPNGCEEQIPGLELDPSPSFRVSMRKILTEDRQPPSLPSSSANVEIEEIPAGNFCIWRPRSPRLAPPTSPGSCKKSNSTGSAKSAWRFRNVMHRSSSNGQETLVFLSTDAIKGGEMRCGKKGSREVSAHEMHYIRNRMMREEDRRRTYLPYRRDLVGFFANVNGLGRNFRPF